MKKEYNIKMFNAIFTIVLFIPILLLIKYLLGYKLIVYIEAFIYLILLTLIFKFNSKRPYKLYKSILIIYLIFIINSIYIVSFDFKGIKETIFYEILSLIPAIYYVIIFTYYLKTNKININE